MGGAGSTHERERERERLMRTTVLIGKPGGKRTLGRLCVDGKIILEWILGKFI